MSGLGGHMYTPDTRALRTESEHSCNCMQMQHVQRGQAGFEKEPPMLPLLLFGTRKDRSSLLQKLTVASPTPAMCTRALPLSLVPLR